MRKLIDLDTAIIAVEKESQVDGAYGYMDTKSIVDLLDDLPSAEPDQKWILCSEQMPEEYNSIWERFYGTERFSKSMWRKQSDEVIVTELFEDGTMRTDTASTHDGEWFVGIECVKRQIIAWMPLPEPYQAERHEDGKTD